MARERAGVVERGAGVAAAAVPRAAARFVLAGALTESGGAAKPFVRKIRERDAAPALTIRSGRARLATTGVVGARRLHANEIRAADRAVRIARGAECRTPSVRSDWPGAARARRRTARARRNTARTAETSDRAPAAAVHAASGRRTGGVRRTGHVVRAARARRAPAVAGRRARPAAARTATELSASIGRHGVLARAVRVATRAARHRARQDAEKDERPEAGIAREAGRMRASSPNETFRKRAAANRHVRSGTSRESFTTDFRSDVTRADGSRGTHLRSTENRAHYR